MTEIEALVFSNCPNLTIYAEADAQPVGWTANWNPDNRPVVWDYVPNGGALNVTLSSFSASVLGGMSVSLNWVTESENGMRGFHVLRTTPAASGHPSAYPADRFLSGNLEGSLADAVRITPNMIAARNTAQVQSYNFADERVSRGGEYAYWIQSIHNDGSMEFHGPVSVKVVTVEAVLEMPLFTVMSGVYPNPVRDNASFDVSVKEGEVATLRIFNIRGQLVREYDDIRTGVHKIQWDGRDTNNRHVASGVYFYKLTSPSANSVQRMVVVK